VRLKKSSDTVPASVNNYLLAHERKVIITRRHPAILIPSATSATGGLFVAAAVNPIAKDNKSLELTIWLLAGFFCLRFISACFNWFARLLVFTSHRVLLISGAFSGRVRNIPLEDIKNMTLRRSRGGRTLGYGAFIFDTGSRPDIIVDYIPYPEQTYLKVNGLIFQRREGSLSKSEFNEVRPTAAL